MSRRHPVLPIHPTVQASTTTVKTHYSRKKLDAACTRGTAILGTAVLSLVIASHWFKVNISPSVPYGLYRITRTAVASDITPGTIVMFPTPTVIAPLIPYRSLLKPVAAGPGGVACVVQQHLYIGSIDYGIVYDETHGTPLPHITGCLVVPPAHIFPASTIPKSLDGRYYGPLPFTTITGIAQPILTWGQAHGTR